MTIEQRQHLLAFLKKYKGKIDGIWGPMSQAAMEEVKKKYVADNDDAALLLAVADWKPDDENKVETGTFWDEIEYFDREEFRCKCGGKYCNGFPAEPKETLVRLADQLRKNLGVPVVVISGLRCRTWNAIQGGVDNSQHMFGEAVDVDAIGVSQSAVEAELDRIGGVRYHYPIDGSDNVHFDVPKGSR